MLLLMLSFYAALQEESGAGHFPQSISLCDVTAAPPYTGPWNYRFACHTSMKPKRLGNFAQVEYGARNGEDPLRPGLSGAEARDEKFRRERLRGENLLRAWYFGDCSVVAKERLRARLS